MQNQPARILQIVSSLSAGSGVLSVVLNWHRNVNTTQIQFDYLYYTKVSATRREEIENLGGRCYELPKPTRYPFKFLREAYRFFKTHRYRTVHSHITHLNLFFYPLAKWFGTKNIIQHAHASKWGLSSFSAVRNKGMSYLVWPLITYKMACSNLAGKVYFGKDFRVINNGIDVDKFVYDPKAREEKRKELGIENNFVIGHVGRFSVEKNHIFLIDVFEQLVKQEPTAKLVLVGGGKLEDKIKEVAQWRQLKNAVVFLQARRDVVQLYQAFDVFVFPSLHEGLGIVAIEAQAAGLPCVLTDTLPGEVAVCNCKKLPLGSAEQWAREILTFAKDFERKDTSARIKEAGFCATDVAKKMQDFYTELEK